MSEVMILAKLQHPNIIKYFDYFTDEQHLYIIMEYANKGDLHRVFRLLYRF